MPASLFGKHGKVSVVELCTDTHVPTGRASDTKYLVSTLELEPEE